MDNTIIDKFISNSATDREIEEVRTYLMEDMERCFDLIVRMRQKAMGDLQIIKDFVNTPGSLNKMVQSKRTDRVVQTIMEDQSVLPRMLMRDFLQDIYEVIIEGKDIE